MAILCTCPGCDKTLRLRDELDGKKVRCPACSHVFQVRDNGAAEEAEEDEPPRRKKSQSVTERTAPRRPVPADEDEDRPRRRKPIAEEEEEDDEDRPRRKRPVREEEDEDDRPRRKNAVAKADPDAVDRPRRRTAAVADEEDDEAEDRPRRAKRKKKRGSGKMVLILSLVGVGVLFLFGGGGFALWYFLGRGGLPAESRYLPDNCNFVGAVNLESILASSAYARIKPEIPNEFKGGGGGFGLPGAMNGPGGKASINEDDISSVLWGGSSFQEVVAVIKTKKKFTAADIKSSQANVTFTEVKAGNFTIYEAPNFQKNFSFCLPESNVILVGPPDALKKILERGSKPKFSDKMQKVLGQADFSKSVVVAATDTGNSGFGNATSKIKIDGILFTVDVRQNIDIAFTAFCSDGQSMADAKKEVEDAKKKGEEQMAVVAPEIRDMIKNVDVKVSGSRVIATLTVDVDKAISAFKSAKAKMGGR
jgi:hypothetical protein